MNKDYIIPLAIFFFIGVGLLSWFAQEGNLVSIWILDILGGSFLFGIAIVYPAAILAYSTLPKGIISKHQIEQLGLDWNDVSKELIENGWAQVISKTEIFLNPHLEQAKSRMVKISENDFSKILSIWQNGNKTFDGKRLIIFILFFTGLWGLIIFAIEINPALGWKYVNFFHRHVTPIIN